MRKSTLIILVILLCGGAGMLFFADMALQPFKETADVAHQMTRLFGDRGDLVAGTQVRLRWVKQERDRTGSGLNLEVTPSEAVLKRGGGLRALARTLGREVPAAFGRAGDGLQWLRLRVFLPGEVQRDVWLERDIDGGFGDPRPPLPERWPETPTPPKAPPAPAEPPVPAPAPAPGPEGGPR